MTLEAWVRPTVAGGWRTAVVKEQPGNLVYGLYANTSGNFPGGRGVRSAARRGRSTARRALPVGHLEPSRRDLRRRDAAPLRQRHAGRAARRRRLDRRPRAAPLHIGGNGVWGEWFNGLIDEVRVYNRALSAARDPERHDPRASRPTRSRRRSRRGRPTPGAAGHQRRHARRPSTFNELMSAGTITSSSVPAEGRGQRRRPGDRHLRRRDEHGDADAAGRAARTARPTPSRSRAAPAASPTSPATRSPPTRRWSFSTEASPPPILVVGSTGEPVRLVPRRDPARTRA